MYICVNIFQIIFYNLYIYIYISIIHTKISRALNTFRVICTNCIMSDIPIIRLNERTKYTGVYVCVTLKVYYLAIISCIKRVRDMRFIDPSSLCEHEAIKLCNL